VNNLSRLQKKYPGIPAKKSAWKVGIFGSFSTRNKKFLTSLKEFLKDNGYYARVSEDLEEEYPRRKDEGKYEYSRRLSELLIEKSQVHIVFFFLETEGEHNINQSASMEFEILNQEQCPNVMIIHEKQSLEQCKSVFRGLKEGMKLKKAFDLWRWHLFARINHDDKSKYTDEDIESSAVMFCVDIIPK
jgi:hypothetical protein